MQKKEYNQKKSAEIPFFCLENSQTNEKHITNNKTEKRKKNIMNANANENYKKRKKNIKNGPKKKSFCKNTHAKIL